MAKYTTELRSLIESGFELTALDDYPIFEEAYRAVLNERFLKHFWMREIGFETPALFNHYLSNTLFEIMPYYNQLFESARIKIDPIGNYNLWQKDERKDKGESSSETGTDTDTYTKGKAITSLPSNGIVSMNDIEENVYANSADLNNANTNTKAASKADGKTSSEMEYIKHIAGNSNVSQAELLMKYRDAFINPLRDFLNDKELNQCFMGVY